MDGRSIARLVIPSTDGPALPASAAAHVRALAGAEAAPWRTHHFIEYYSLGSVVRTEHLIDDPKSNTYRALRFVGDARHGDFLYAEFTALALVLVDLWPTEKLCH